jgi:hypothetical protein
LAAIDQAHPEGANLLASAREVLKIIDKANAGEISVADVADIAQIFAKTHFNGDGIIPVMAAEDEACQAVITDMLTCVEGELDRSGELGLSLEKLEAFFTQAQAYLDWWELGSNGSGFNLPLGEDTMAAVENFKRVKPKIDDYFTRCQLAEFDTQASSLLNPSVAQYEQITLNDLSPADTNLTALPLAKIEAYKALPLTTGLNPAWAAQIEQLAQQVLIPLLGDIDGLSQGQWQEVISQFTAYETWLQDKPSEAVGQLGIDRLKEILAGDYQNQLIELVYQDLALAAEAEAIESVERLVYYYRDLYRLLNNFVSFRDFYSTSPNGIFQAGTLYLDGRSCNLCISVSDIAKHSALASSSLIYLAYCECTRPGSQEKMTIAAAFTGGDSDNLMVGRNGIFYDRQGLDWDATVVKIIDHPISIAQAFWSPYKRLGKMLNDQVEKFATARDKDAQDKAIASGTNVASTATAGAAPAPTAFDVGKFAGIFAAIGLAIGAIGTALASIVSGFVTLAWWQMPLALGGVLLFISGPSMLIAALKLRRRNLAPILDASGWAINTKALINLSFGRLLTGTATLPKNAERQLVDPFADKETPWRSYVILAVLLGILAMMWKQDLYQKWLAKPEKPAVTEPAKPTGTDTPKPAVPTATPAPKP